MENVDVETINPVILAGESELVDLYIRFVHEKICLHAGGVAGILHRVRTRFLIVRARRAPRKGCKVCAEFRAESAAAPTPGLTKFRVETAVVFNTTGIDAAGPIPVRNGQGGKVPAYIMLFVCAVPRAVRLELVPNLSTYELERHEDTRSFFTKHQITWEFNLERSPWRNGFAERTVRIVKEPLRRILGKNTLPFREPETVLTSIEKIVNDRPLTCVVRIRTNFFR